MYFARMNSSFSDLEAFSCSLVFTLASHMEFASELPPLLSRAARFAWGQQSKERLLTLLMCEPRFLWIPLQSMQTRIPRLRLAQSGLLRLQSAHEVFPGKVRIRSRSGFPSHLVSEARISAWIASSHCRTSLGEQT